MKKKLITTSWLISLITTIAFLIISIITIANYRNNNARFSIKRYLYFSTAFYDGSNYSELNNEINKINSNIELTIIDFDGNVLFDTNTYNEFTNHLAREEVMDLGTVLNRDSIDNKNILYIAGKDSSSYIIISMPNPSIKGIVGDLVLASMGIFILISILSYFVLDQLNKKAFKPIQKGVDKLATFVGDEAFYSDNDLNLLTSSIHNIHNSIIDKINAIDDEKNKMELLLNSMNQGILILNDSGKIVLINEFATNIFKNPKDKMTVSFLDKHYLYLIRNANLQNQIEETLSQGLITSIDIIIDNKIYLVNINPSRNKWTTEIGNRNGAAIFIIDVTEYRNLEKTKRDFFANASHELKSPLTTILGYQQMISENMISNPEELDDAVKRTIKEAQRMDKILKEMLELSRIESKYEVIIEDINLKDIIEDIIDSYNIEINDKQLKLTLILEDYTVRMNQSHCNQLVNNLIDNAIKYIDQGGRLDIMLKGDNLTIRDTGIGIAKTNQNRVFERFYRVDKGRSKALGGTGLGLAIVKHICSVYGINIILKSELGVGTEFSLIFPKKK